MSALKYTIFGLMTCLAASHDVVARPCGHRAKQARAVTAQSAVFAVPVATVVVVAPPAFFYSYRASAQPTLVAPQAVETRDEPLATLTAEGLLRQHCLKCHRGESAIGGVSFFAADGTLETLLPRRAILEMASPHEQSPAKMPPGEAAKLNGDELEVLRQWAEPPRDLRY